MQKAVILGLAIFLIGLVGFGIVYVPSFFEEEKLLLDLSTELRDRGVEPAADLSFLIAVRTPGYRKLVEVRLEHRVKDLDTGSTLVSKRETLRINARGAKESSMDAPGSPGTYVLETVAHAQGATAKSSFVFRVRPEPSCSDRIQNQDEEGIDCGGVCEPCTEESCYDGIRNQGEQGVDCGGPCKPCAGESCSDRIQNQDEQGIDCGGVCEPCPEPSCHDGLRNQDEEGIDCGGVCDPCTEADIPFEDLSFRKQLALVKEASAQDPEEAFALCMKIYSLNWRDACISRIADESGNPGYCYDIKGVAKKDQCYMNFALQGRFEYCDKLTNVYLRNSCLNLQK